MFYKVTQNDIREDNPSIDAVTAFDACTSAELKFMVLVYDYDTPFKELEWDARRNRAAIQAGFIRNEKTGKHTKKAADMLAGKVEHLQRAIEVFRGIQKDIDKEAMQAYNKQIEQFISKSQESKETDKDWELAIKINAALPKMLRERKELQDLLGLRDSDIEEDLDVETVDLQLSALDLYNEELIDGTRG